jgi:hypothetical protein
VAPVIASAESNIEAMSKHLLPLYKFDDRDRPQLNGTGVLVEHEGNQYLITATHVLKQNPDYVDDQDGEIYCFMEGKLTLVPPETWRVLASQDGERDLIDVSFVLLGKVLMNNFDKAECYQFNEAAFPEEKHLIIAAMGCPATKSRLNSKGLPKSISTYFSYGLPLTAERLYEAGFDAEINFGFHFDIKKCRIGEALDVKAVRPNGISGGAIWINDFSRINVDKPPILAGIITDYDPAQKILVGTRMTHLTRKM